MTGKLLGLILTAQVYPSSFLDTNGDGWGEYALPHSMFPFLSPDTCHGTLSSRKTIAISFQLCFEAVLTARLRFSVKGITSKLDYLKQLGIDIVWVSPSQSLSFCRDSIAESQ